MTAYTVRDQRQTTARPVFCLQCNKAVGPAPDLSLDVRDEHGTLIGYLHRVGLCKDEWEKAHPAKA